jgi:hypothetical protein
VLAQKLEYANAPLRMQKKQDYLASKIAERKAKGIKVWGKRLHMCVVSHQKTNNVQHTPVYAVYDLQASYKCTKRTSLLDCTQASRAFHLY